MFFGDDAPKKVWFYQGRHGELEAFEGTDVGFMLARESQDRDNGCTVEDIRADGGDVDGSREEGYFYIDDGGRIDLVDVR